MIKLSELSFNGLCLKCCHATIKQLDEIDNCDMALQIICPFWYVSEYAVFTNQLEECDDHKLKEEKPTEVSP